jgi:class 3 adenylate cyclase
MEPDAVVATLNECFGVLVEVVLAHGGMLDKFLGDGLMAVFATPDAPVRNAEAAVACALDAHAALALLNEDRQRRGLPPLYLGIGITCGEVVAGQIGSPQRLEYTVVGSEVNRAHRLQALAGPGETIINDAVAARLGDALEVESRGLVALKGFAEPVPVYRVHACLDCAA